MLIDPQSPASELTIRAEIALKMVQANATLAGTRGPHILTEYILESSIKAADLFIRLMNRDKDLDTDSPEEEFEFARQYYLQD